MRIAYEGPFLLPKFLGNSKIRLGNVPSSVSTAKVPNTKSIPLQSATNMSIIMYEIEYYQDYKFEDGLNFHQILSGLTVKQYRLILP